LTEISGEIGNVFFVMMSFLRLVTSLAMPEAICAPYCAVLKSITTFLSNFGGVLSHMIPPPPPSLALL
jgi:hypothetical protein